MTLDSVTGLYYSRNRNYDASLGRWINQDPLQYINGANTYQFVMSNPVGNVDPEGENVYVYDNLNPHGGFVLHQNIVVDTPNGQSGVSFGLIPGTGTFAGTGEVYLDNGETHWWTSEELHLPPLLEGPFDAIAQAYLQSLIGKKGPYNALTNNCRDFSQSQFKKIEDMYNQFLRNNWATFRNMMNMQNNMIPGWSSGGATFTS
jgi:RHS repeat-associated protein